MDAKLRLDFARNYVQQVHCDLRSPDIPAVDGDFAARRAIKLESAALREYARILRIFTDLVVKGVVPDEADWRNPE
jgi:hypothetical protein